MAIERRGSRLENSAVNRSHLLWPNDAQMTRLEPFLPKPHAKSRVNDGRAPIGVIFINRIYAFHPLPSGIQIEHANWQQELCDLRAQFALVVSFNRSGRHEDLWAEWSQMTDQFEEQLADMVAR